MKEFRFVGLKFGPSKQPNHVYITFYNWNIRESSDRKKKGFFFPRYGFWKKHLRYLRQKLKTPWNTVQFSELLVFLHILLCSRLTLQKNEIKYIISLTLTWTNSVFLCKLKTGPSKKLKQYLNEALNPIRKLLVVFYQHHCQQQR